MPLPSVPLNAIRQPAILYDTEGRIVAANDLAESSAGQPLGGLSAADVVRTFRHRHPDGTPIAPAELPACRALAGKEVVELPLAITHADGRTLEIVATASPVREGDSITGALVVWQDVTQRNRAEAALRASEEEFRALFEHSHDAIVLSDPRSGTIHAANPAARRMLGRAEEELIGRGPEVMVDPDEPRAVAMLQERANGGAAHTELTYRRSDGSTFPGEVSTALFIDGRGDLQSVAIIRDISERKRAAEALRESEERFRLALRNVPVSVAVMDRDLRYVWAYNQRTAPPEGVVGLTDADLFTPGEAAHLTAIKRRVLREGVEIREQMWLDRPGGRIFLDCYFEPVRDEAGRVTGVGIATVDLTQRRTAEEALRESEERFRALFEQSHDAIVLTDPRGDGRILAANPAACRMLGCDEEELIGLGRDMLFDLTDPRTIALLEERARSGAACAELIYRRRDGSTFPGEVTTALFTDGCGDARSVAIIRDVTERKAAEEALRESETRFRMLHESIRDPFVQVAMDGRIIGFNDLYCEMLGYSREEIGALTYQDVTPERWHAYEDAIVRDQITARGYSDVYEKEYRRKDGTVIPVELRTILSRDEDGRPSSMWGLVRDISERKQAERRLAEYAEQLRHSNEELQRFAYVASHDLQEPLRSIVSFAQLLERRYRGQLGDDADDFIGFIVEGGNRMQRLINDLLQVSRIETGARPPEPTDPGRIARDAVALLNGRLCETGGTVTVGEMPAVMADPGQLEQVFANLVGNAIKYRREGVLPAIAISARRLDGMVEFAVSDNGIGIEEEYHDRIFEMFRRLHTHDKYEGTGIGLAVVKRIIDRHGGKIRVESTPGEGSTFFFTLPAT